MWYPSGGEKRPVLQIGDTVKNRYSVLGYLGRGGQRRVYRALDSRGRPGRRTVVIKEMYRRKHFHHEMAGIELFNQEVKLFLSLSHPNIAPILDYFVEGGSLYIVQEYVEGPNLKQYLASHGPLEEEEAVDILVQMLRALDYLHSQVPPVTLGDIKPSNTIYRDGKAVVVDMGGARSRAVSGEGYEKISLSTRGYAPPKGTDLDPVGQDLYALGVMIHQLLTGHDPVSSTGPPPPLRALREDVSPRLAGIVARALRRNSGRGYSSAFQMLLDVEDYLLGRKGRSHRWLERLLDLSTPALLGLTLLVPLSALMTGGRLLGQPSPPILLLSLPVWLGTLLVHLGRHHRLKIRGLRSLFRWLHGWTGPYRRIHLVALTNCLLLTLCLAFMLR